MGVAIKGDLSRTVKSDRPTRLLCPARLDPCKGHADLLQALAILRQRGFPFHCNLAGNGPLYKSVKAMIDGLNLSDCVTIRGLVPYDNLIQELRNGYYDAVVLPSVEDSSVSTIYEGIPVALMEAMEAGIPCVSTRIGSIPELINSENGILVEQHRPHDLAEALTKMADVNLREKLGQAARRYIIRDFNAVTTTKTLYELMRRELVANPVQTVRSTRTVAGSQHAN